jgi:prephenate dehydratase
VPRVAFLGPPGTFTEEALLSDAGLAAGELLSLGSIPEVIAAIERGEADCGVVPVENSIEGSVNVTLDTLAFESDLLVQGELVRPVSLTLLARRGTKLRDVRTVISFPTATAQCRDWLARTLPKAAVAPANSTAGAVEQVARSRARGVAAIGTHLAAELYGLAVLAEDIEDHPENATRFLVLGRGVPPPTGHDKTTIVCYQREDRPGSLLAILQEFAARSINLTRLESRPTKQGLGRYCFVIDCEGHVMDELLADALRNLAAKHGGVKFLGSYPAASTEAGKARRHAAGQAWREAVRWVEGLRAEVRLDEAARDGGGPAAAATAPRARSRRTPRT